MKMRSVSLLPALLLFVLSIACFVPSAIAGTNKECASTSDVAAACGKCGDGYCAKQCGETAKSCPADCGVVESEMLACGKCGDGRCTPQCGETATSCPKDCGVETLKLIVNAEK